MAIIIQPLQIGSVQTGTGIGKWCLCKWNDEDTVPTPRALCSHEHDSAEEARTCSEAKVREAISTGNFLVGFDVGFSPDVHVGTPIHVDAGGVLHLHIGESGELDSPGTPNSVAMAVPDAVLNARKVLQEAVTAFVKDRETLGDIIANPRKNTIPNEGRSVPKPGAATSFPGASKLPDSGARTEFGTGAKRDAMLGKGLPSQIPPDAIRAMARRFEDGAAKYGLSNWMGGIPLSRYYDAMMRHLMLWGENDRTEEHDGAVLWNMAAAMWTLKQIEKGLLPKELNDLPYYVPNNPD